MNKKAIYLGIVIVIIIIIGIFIYWTKHPGVEPPLTPGPITGNPSNLAISDELGGSKSSVAPTPAGIVRGSCYIKADSQCMDYLGAAFTPDRIKMVCSNDGAIISTNACPTTAKVGGCHSMIGTEAEMISWAYSNGDKPAEGATLDFNKTICGGMAKSQWVEVK
ncbi:MAG: hypothetical protein WC640_03020 [Candidatus Paceibacterota bacterium]|jgi:hypothetical protein